MEGHAYVVLGATGGIGTPLVHRLHARGAKTVLAAQDEERLCALGDEVGAPFKSIDAADPAQAFVTGQTLGVDGGLSTVRVR